MYKSCPSYFLSCCTCDQMDVIREYALMHSVQMSFSWLVGYHPFFHSIYLPFFKPLPSVLASDERFVKMMKWHFHFTDVKRNCLFYNDKKLQWDLDIESGRKGQVKYNYKDGYIVASSPQMTQNTDTMKCIYVYGIMSRIFLSHYTCDQTYGICFDTISANLFFIAVWLQFCSCFCIAYNFFDMVLCFFLIKHLPQ